MNFKIGDTIEALEDAFIERDSFTNTLIYSKGTKGKILYICKDDLIVKFDSGYGDCKWCIPKEKVKLVNEEKEMNFVGKVKETYMNFLNEKWSRFVKENIIINCESELDFENFINFACKNNDIDYENYKRCFEYYNNKLCFSFEDGTLYYSPKKYYVGEKEYCDFKILTWNEFIKNDEVVKMNKTFKEVIGSIKKGEVWESNNKKIYFNSFGQIQIESENNDQNIMAFDDSIMYTLKRKEYDYIEAYTAYLKEGKEIESIYSGINYKRMDGKDFYIEDYKDEWRECSGIDFAEMNAKWYINN